MEQIKIRIGLVCFCIFMLAVLAGCAGPAADISGVTRPAWLHSSWHIIYSPQLHPEKTFEEALAELEKDMNANSPSGNLWFSDATHKPESANYYLKRFAIDHEGMSIQGVNFSGSFDSEKITTIDFDLGELPKYTMYVIQTNGNTWNYGITLRGFVSFYFKNPIEMQRMADNFLLLQQSVKQLSAERLADFKEKAAQYRALAVKPAISEEQRKFVVQANALNQLKDYSAAIKLYRKAIEVDPVSYPAAYFNLALISAQTKRYDKAIDSMKKYLLLVPEAQDARSAQDKVYEWEALSQK